MTLKEYMAEVKASATGERMGRQMVLAIDCSESPTGDEKPDTFAVVANHIENHGASLNASTSDKSYIGEGDMTLRSGVQRIFSVAGQLLRGDAFHDFITSHKVKFGVGTEVQRKYVYFDPGTKKGESGMLTISVTNDGASAASDPNDIAATLSSFGVPKEYEYTEGE